MVVYVDIIVLINLLIDLLLIVSLSFLLKRKTSMLRILLSALFGSLSTIFLFSIHNNILLLMYKLLISILMVIIAFKYENFNYFKDNLIYLYILSIILGGGIYLFNNSISFYNKGLIFEHNGIEINLILLLLISPIILYKYIKSERNYKINYSNYYDIDIYYNDVKVSGTGFLDTGNKLKDPYFHKPIILVNSSLIKDKVKTFLVPYYTVNNKDLLEVFSPKKIYVNNKKVKNALIGLTDVNYNGIKIILNKEIL